MSLTPAQSYLLLSARHTFLISAKQSGWSQKQREKGPQAGSANAAYASGLAQRDTGIRCRGDTADDIVYLTYLGSYS